MGPCKSATSQTLSETQFLLKIYLLEYNYSRNSRILSPSHAPPRLPVVFLKIRSLITESRAALKGFADSGHESPQTGGDSGVQHQRDPKGDSGFPTAAEWRSSLGRGRQGGRGLGGLQGISAPPSRAGVPTHLGPQPGSATPPRLPFLSLEPAGLRGAWNFAVARTCGPPELPSRCGRGRERDGGQAARVGLRVPVTVTVTVALGNASLTGTGGRPRGGPASAGRT